MKEESQQKTHRCYKCKTVKSLTEFYKDRAKHDGYGYRCKLCNKITNQEFKKKNPTYSSDYSKARYGKIPDKISHNKERYRKAQQRYKAYQEKSFKTPRGRLAMLFDAARERAKKKSLPFTITLDGLEQLYHSQNGSCSLTGIPFDLTKHSKSKRGYSPFGPSIDRIIPQLGYVPSNVRIILTGMNLALNDFGDSVYQTISIHYLTKRGFKVQAPP